jgi:hypothetical protein
MDTVGHCNACAKNAELGSIPFHLTILIKHIKQTHYEKDVLQNQTKIQTLKASVDNLRMLNRKTICIRSSIGFATG